MGIINSRVVFKTPTLKMIFIKTDPQSKTKTQETHKRLKKIHNCRFSNKKINQNVYCHYTTLEIN